MDVVSSGEVAKATENIIQQLLGPLSSNIGELLGSIVDIPYIKERKLRNAFKTLSRIQKVCKENNTKIKNINLKLLIPLLEGIELEEEEDLQEIWANLFINHIDADKNLTTNVYPLILKQLSSNELKLLEYAKQKGSIQTSGIVQNDPLIDFTTAEIANLTRLGILEEQQAVTPYSGDIDESNGQYKWNYESGGTDVYSLTWFGIEFLKACKR